MSNIDVNKSFNIFSFDDFKELGSLKKFHQNNIIIDIDENINIFLILNRNEIRIAEF